MKAKKDIATATNTVDSSSKRAENTGETKGNKKAVASDAVVASVIDKANTDSGKQSSDDTSATDALDRHMAAEALLSLHKHKDDSRSRTPTIDSYLARITPLVKDKDITTRYHIISAKIMRQSVEHFRWESVVHVVKQSFMTHIEIYTRVFSKLDQHMRRVCEEGFKKCSDFEDSRPPAVGVLMIRTRRLIDQWLMEPS